jgi:hypothetical protein
MHRRPCISRKRFNLTARRYRAVRSPAVRRTTSTHHHCLAKSSLCTRQLIDHRSSIHATRRKSLGPAASTRLVCGGILDGQLANSDAQGFGWSWTGIESKCGCHVADVSRTNKHTINPPYLGLSVTNNVVDGLMGRLTRSLQGLINILDTLVI